MALLSVYHKIQILKKTAGKLDKKEYLKTFLGDGDFREFVQLALSHDLVFHISKLPNFEPNNGAVVSGDIFKYLRRLSQQKGTKKAEKETLRDLASVNQETYEVVCLILNKSLGCGVAASLINDVVPGTVFVMPYMRCMSEKEGLKRIKYPAVVQKKADGAFAYGMVIDGVSTLLSRNGLKIDLLGTFDDDLRLLEKENLILTMELTAKDTDGNDLPRTYGNGLITKAIKGTITALEASQLYAQCWDIVPADLFWAEEDPTQYIQRWRALNQITQKAKRIKRVQSRIVCDEAAAREFFRKMLKMGMEGAVLKNLDGGWKSHTSPNQCKLKKKLQAEFIITGWYFGEAGKKYEKCMGGISFESLDGLVKSNTGSGFTDAERGFLGFDANGIPIVDKSIFDYWSSMTGKIIGIEFDSLVQDKNNKNKEEYSLFLPIYLDVRLDKYEADGLPYLKEL